MGSFVLDLEFLHKAKQILYCGFETTTNSQLTSLVEGSYSIRVERELVERTAVVGKC